jgi:hypothetical protein
LTLYILPQLSYRRFGENSLIYNATVESQREQFPNNHFVYSKLRETVTSNKHVSLQRKKSGTFADRSLRVTYLACLNRRFIIVLQDMVFADLVKNFLVFNGKQTLISVYTETVYPIYYGASAILSTNSFHKLFVLNDIMQYTCSGLQGELFFQNFRTKVTSIKLNKNLVHFLLSRHWGTYRYSSTGGGRSPSHFRRFIPEEETRYPLYRRLRGYQGLPGWVRKVSPLRGSTPETSSPQRVATALRRLPLSCVVGHQNFKLLDVKYFTVKVWS